MHLKYTLFFLLLIGYGWTASAQETKQEQPAKKGCSCSFSSINQLGILAGSWGAGPLLQSVNGFRYKTWFAGVGVGVDIYKRGTFPVFLDVRKDILNARNTPFIYGEAGTHFPDKKMVSENQWYESEYASGFYFDAGIGYRVGKKSKSGFLASAGYSYKYVTRVMLYKGPCGFAGCDNRMDSYYKYYLHRISIKVGWQL
jgi:hypothetical protein